MRGKFITFEGGEGSGKSTQARNLVNRLKGAGIPAIFTREPGGSPLAERIRSKLLEGAFKSCGSDIEALLFAAARSDHLHRTILPAVEAGTTVICDRFFDSTAVYQVIGGTDPAFLDILKEEATGGVSPDVTLILDIDTDIASGRAASRRQEGAPDRFESEGLEFHRQVRQGFLEIAEKDPHRCIVIDANGTMEVVGDRVQQAVAQRFAFTI